MADADPDVTQQIDVHSLHCIEATETDTAPESVGMLVVWVV